MYYTDFLCALNRVAVIPGTKKPAKRFVEKPCRPQTSLNGSFTIDQVDDNATFVEPVRRLSFDEPTAVFIDATAPVSYAPVDSGVSTSFGFRAFL